MPTCALALLLLPGVCRAQVVDDATRRAARNLGQEGVEAFQAHDYRIASEKLDKAYRALQAPSLGLWSARSFVKQNRLVEAAERYQEVVRLQIIGGDRAIQQQAQADAAAELEQLSPQIPNLVVSVVGATPDVVSVTIDGAPLASALLGEKRPIDPGKHQVRGKNGDELQSVDVEVAAGKNSAVELRFGGKASAVAPDAERPAPAADSTAPAIGDSARSTPPGANQRTLAFVAMGAGGLGLIVGGVAGGLALGKKSQIDDSPSCRDNHCLRSETSVVGSYSTLRTVASIGIVGGAALATIGVVLFVRSPKSEPTALLIGPGSFALARRF